MRYLTLVAMFVIFVLSRPQISHAAVMDDYPEGTYQRSCKNISMRGDDLRARCLDNGGHYRDAYLDGADRCWGDISNSDGHLICNKNGALPSGSYTQTCRDIRMRYNVLYARCQTRDNNWVDTSLARFNSCNNPIENVDGQLRCSSGVLRSPDWDRDRGRDRGPRGSYTETCRDIDTRGRSIRALCQTIGGRWTETVLDDYDRCVGDIVNDDGRLECTRRGGRLVPAGSYSSSCRNIYVRGDNLRAMCQDRSGRWVWSELHDWDDCRRGIVNDDGRLRCVRR